MGRRALLPCNIWFFEISSLEGAADVVGGDIGVDDLEISYILRKGQAIYLVGNLLIGF